jgi:glycosyltransferase involved in cell wall biosynthesis
MPRLLLWSDSVCATNRSYGRIAQQIVAALHDWEVVQVALNHPPHETHPHVKIFDAKIADGTGVGADLAYSLYADGGFDALLIINDTYVINPWAERLAKARAAHAATRSSPCPIFFYFPVDGPTIADWEMVEISDVPICPTKWGADEAQSHIPSMFGRQIFTIPHGVDTTTFRLPTKAETQQARREIFGETPSSPSLNIAMVAANSQRKDLYQALQAVALFKRMRAEGTMVTLGDPATTSPTTASSPPLSIALPPVRLYMHTRFEANGFNINVMAKHLGLELWRDVIPVGTIGLDAPDSTLRRVYWGADLTLFTSRREGFGLPMIESLACGVPVVAPDYGPFQEVLGQHPLLAKLLYAVPDQIWTKDDNRGPGWFCRPENIVNGLLEYLGAMLANQPGAIRVVCRGESLKYDSSNLTRYWRRLFAR